MTQASNQTEPVARLPRPEILRNIRNFARAYRAFGQFPGIVLN